MNNAEVWKSMILLMLSDNLVDLDEQYHAQRSISGKDYLDEFNTIRFGLPRRTGKSRACLLVAEHFSRLGKRVALVYPNHQMRKAALATLCSECRENGVGASLVSIGSDRLFDDGPYDLVIVDEAQIVQKQNAGSMDQIFTVLTLEGKLLLVN